MRVPYTQQSTAREALSERQMRAKLHVLYHQRRITINSEEYPGTVLHKNQFILQAIGSKIELLALTDVEYITFLV